MNTDNPGGPPGNVSGSETTDEAGVIPAPATGERFESPASMTTVVAESQSALSGSNFQPLDPRTVAAERTLSWIIIAVVTVGGLFGQAIYLAINWPPDLIFLAIAVAYVLLLAFLVWAGHFYPVIALRHAAWRLDEQGFEIRRGVWWRHEITVPRSRVQHTDVHQGPLMRKFGLARLVINTAGTHNASIALDGLSLETAQKLRSELVADSIPQREPSEFGEPR
ncbi:MAG: PH domain-containing protein [Aureliella sp.]